MNHFTSRTVVPNLAMKARKTGYTHSYSLSVGYTDRMEWQGVTDIHGIHTHSAAISTGLDHEFKG